MAYTLTPAPGTISIAVGDDAVTGSGTLFTAYRKGALINVPGFGACQLAADPADDHRHRLCGQRCDEPGRQQLSLRHGAHRRHVATDLGAGKWQIVAEKEDTTGVTVPLNLSTGQQTDALLRHRCRRSGRR